ncbi:MAG: hypothetical protein Q4B33_01450 [Fusobacterium sp.]|nr:hypothetical protein [Fusobacterium sp.]
MKKIKRIWIINLIFIVLFSSCASIKSSKDVSLTKIEGRKQLVVNYNRNQVRSVRIKNVILDSGVPYYLEPGEYRMTYQETPIISGIMDFSYRDRDDRNSGRSFSERAMTTSKIINLQDDTVIDIEGKNFGISGSIKINSKKNY